MVDEANNFKDEAVEELENSLVKKIRSTINSEIELLKDDLIDALRLSLRNMMVELENSKRESQDALHKLEKRIPETIQSIVEEMEHRLSGQLCNFQADLKEYFSDVLRQQDMTQLFELLESVKSTLLETMKVLCEPVKTLPNGFSCLNHAVTELQNSLEAERQGRKADYEKIAELYEKSINPRVTATLIISCLAALMGGAALVLWFL